MSGAAKHIGSVTMPAGEYFVGDPCYAVPDSLWMTWLEAADYINERRYLLAELDGYPVLGIGTAHGDGCYPGDDGNVYPVDAGLIGLVPVATAAVGCTSPRVTFKDEFSCTYEDGTIVLGHIRIDTDPADEPEDDYEDEDEDESEDSDV